MAYTLLEQVKIRLKQFQYTSDTMVFNREEENPLIEQLIEQATSDIKAARHYPADYTDDRIEADIAGFQKTIVNLAVYDYSQAGEAYMNSYSENGISRSWVEREKLLATVRPIAVIV